MATCLQDTPQSTLLYSDGVRWWMLLNFGKCYTGHAKIHGHRKPSLHTIAHHHHIPSHTIAHHHRTPSSHTIAHRHHTSSHTIAHHHHTPPHTITSMNVSVKHDISKRPPGVISKCIFTKVQTHNTSEWDTCKLINNKRLAVHYSTSTMLRKSANCKDID